MHLHENTLRSKYGSGLSVDFAGRELWSPVRTVEFSEICERLGNCKRWPDDLKQSIVNTNETAENNDTDMATRQMIALSDRE